MIFRQPGCGGADEVGELGGDGVEDGRGDGDSVEPDIPGGHESAEIAECPTRPDIEAAFERHLAVEVDDRYGHRQIEENHGADPGDRLCPAEPGSDANPGASDDAKYLREDEVAKTERAMKTRLICCRG